jgi:hypothetical protein
MIRCVVCFLAVTTAIAACAGESPLEAFNGVCTRELRVQFTPADTAIGVGQGFQAHVSLSSCGGAELLTDAFTWRSEDPTVAAINPLTGAVVGKSVGATRIAVAGHHYGNLGSIQVRVGGP